MQKLTEEEIKKLVHNITIHSSLLCSECFNPIDVKVPLKEYVNVEGGELAKRLLKIRCPKCSN